jgi:hypothetical protein
MSDDIEIRLTGEGIRPGLVRSHELAEILAAVEDFVSAEAAHASPDARREEIVVGLYEIGDSSIGLRFKTSFAAVAVPAFVAASQHVAAGDFHSLSPQSLKPLQVIADFAKRRGATAEFKAGVVREPIAKIDASTVIPQQPRITGLTEITAKTLRVGGKIPRAMLEMLDGTVIYCEIPEDVAVELGHRLYKLSTFTGTATWDSTTLELEYFKIESFRSFEAQGFSKTLADLRSEIGLSFIQTGDVNQLASSLRRGEDEE